MVLAVAGRGVLTAGAGHHSLGIISALDPAEHGQIHERAAELISSPSWRRCPPRFFLVLIATATALDMWSHKEAS